MKFIISLKNYFYLLFACNSLSLLRRIQIVGQSHYILYSNTNREMSGCDELIRDEKQNESIIEGTGRVQ